MKLYFLPVAATALAALPLGGLAQTTSPDAAASAAPSAPAMATPAAPAMPALTPNGKGSGISSEDVDRLKAARAKALQDPTVIAAMQKRDDAVKAARAALIAQDPTLEPLLNKMQPMGSGTNAAPTTPPQYTPEERERLIATRGKLNGMPEGKALGEAGREANQAMRAAMLKADPTLAPIMEKIESMSHGGAMQGAPH